MKFLLRSTLAFCAAAGIAASASCAPASQAATSSAKTDAGNAAALQACAAVPKDGAPCALQAEFGLFKLSPRDEVLDFKPGHSVPLVDDQAYGWLLHLNKKSGRVRVLERFTMPATPRTWGIGPNERTGRSGDSSSISVDLTLQVYDGGVVYRAWSVAPGDPVGHHVIQVWVEDAAPLRFEFDVVPAAAKAP
jgi:hypothetical protein